MQQKQLKYILIASVALIWGIVVYKIVQARGNDVVKPSLSPATHKTEAPQPKNFTLINDYPDPFLGIPEEDTASIKKEPAVVSQPAVAAEPANVSSDLSFIQYHGMIYNPGKKLKVAIIKLDGKEMLIREKEEIGEITFLRFDKTQLKIKYKGRLQLIKKLE